MRQLPHHHRLPRIEALHARGAARRPLPGPAREPQPAATATDAKPERPPPPATAKVTSWTFKGLGTACARCHTDPHSQELGTACERCHTVDEIGFAAGKFSHGTTAFQLTGRHVALRCSQCHAPRAGAPGQPPAGARLSPARDDSGRVLSFKAKGTACAACHKDIHLGQLGQQCQSCHSPETFSRQDVHAQAAEGGLLRRRSRRSRLRRLPQVGDRRHFPSGKGTAVPIRRAGQRLRVVPRPQGRPSRRPRQPVRAVSHAGRVAVRIARVPQGDAVPARGPSPRGPVRGLPRGGRHEGDADEVLRLPLDSAPRRSVRDAPGQPVRDVPPADQLDGGQLEPHARGPASRSISRTGCSIAARATRTAASPAPDSAV